jgi:hypothetical protein
MATDFDPVQATTQPNVLTLAPDISPVPMKFISKSIPNQSWAMTQALNFLQMYTAGLRDPEAIADMLTSSMDSAIDKNASNQTTLSVLYQESSNRRAALGLDPIDENVYKSQRDPRLLKGLVVNLLNDKGVESDLQEDMTVESRTLSDVEVSDPDVRPAWQIGASPEEEEAIRIAQKLGLQVMHSSSELINLVIEDPPEIDSTDPYIKKVGGS